MRVDCSRHAAGTYPDALHLPYLGMGLSTEERLPGIPWMYGLSTLFEVRFFTPAQIIFLVKAATVSTEQGHPFRECPPPMPLREFVSTNGD
jgi:hypothetical protein